MATWAATRPNRDLSAMSMYDVCADPQAQAATTDTLGGEERFEFPVESFRVHPRTAVRDGKDQPLLTGLPPHRYMTSQQESSTARHCVDRVRDDVAQDLPDITLKTQDRLICTLALLDNDLSVGQARLVRIERGRE